MTLNLIFVVLDVQLTRDLVPVIYHDILVREFSNSPMFRLYSETFLSYEHADDPHDDPIKHQPFCSLANILNVRAESCMIS